MSSSTDPDLGKRDDPGKGGSAARRVQSLADAPPIAPRRQRQRRSPWARRLVALAVLAAAGSAAAYYWRPLSEKVRELTGEKTGTGPVDIQTYSVKRGPMRIAVVSDGKLRAVKNHEVIVGVNGKITWLAEAGSKVKKGDLLVTLDKKQLEDERKLRQSELETQRAALAVAEQSVPITRSKGEAEVAAAKTKAEEAALALKQFKSIEAPKQLSEFETQITESRNKLAEAQKKRSEAQAQLDEKLLDDGDEKKQLEQQVSLQKDAISSLTKVLNNQEDQRKLFRAYNYPQQLKSKEQAAANSKLEVTKAETAAASEMLQKDAEVRKARALIEGLEADIKQIEERIGKCSAYAPADGLVFYGSPEMMRYGDVNDRIRVGMEWYSDGSIMTIPDLSAFQVDLSIPEVYRGRVTTGMPASITIDAVPGLVLAGKLTTIASVARNKVSWDSSSPQVFDSTLLVSGVDQRMVAGMSVRVEITTAELTGVLTAPIEGVFNEAGKPAVFLWIESGGKGHAEKRPVLTGQVNDHFVEIKKGLSEGDRLLLSRPATFVTPANYLELVEQATPPKEEFRAAASATAATTGTSPADGTAPAASAPAQDSAAETDAPAAP